MAKSKTSKTDVQDPSSKVIQEIDQVDLKALSYTQLQCLHATAVQAVDDVNEDLKLRAEDDNEGDTVRIPVTSAAE